MTNLGLLNIIALTIDLAGVILLYRFGILPDNLWEHLLMDSGMSENDEKRHRKWSKIGIRLLIMGFSLQLITTIIQNLPQE